MCNPTLFLVRADRDELLRLKFFALDIEQPHLTAREMRDWQGYAAIGNYSIRPADARRTSSGKDGWFLYAEKRSISSQEPRDPDAFVEEFSTFSDALKHARAALRAALRLAS